MRNSKTDTITGIPTQAGNFPITIHAWEFAGNTGRNTSGTFTIPVTNPPAPAITGHPAGGNFQPGSFVSLLATQTSGIIFTWEKDGVALPATSSPPQTPPPHGVPAPPSPTPHGLPSPAASAMTPAPPAPTTSRTSPPAATPRPP